MIDKNDKLLLRSIIMEHFTNPENKGLIENEKNIYVKYQDSPTCADAIDVQLTYENNQVKNAKFEGVGCAISTAAIDILCNQIINKSKEEALNILSNYHNMIVGQNYNEDILDELIIFYQIYQQGNRINCALLGADGLKNILESEVK
ncbi:Fe-S cluster assembly sulfur transfer protein SufU [Spiroplasma tabanidicola]|uniref:FeS assembly protein n=1 Tax=Spiroplasma tabanidicola TaxID=324079 RepID=A0A6I6C9R0_9MOLU|nr:SUF system NifU family Fe-S cluster assembly protein [Spiroplasma tabanidicola]QGS52189.1 FeS assembly protein [Spiroplasma tabanidicola]